MYRIQIKYGLQSTTRQFPQPPTVSQLKQDMSLRGELGYGDNCKVLVDGVEQPDFASITAQLVTIETAVNSKAL